MYNETCLDRTLNRPECCKKKTKKNSNQDPNVGNRCLFNLHKQNTCLFRTQKLVLKRFGLDRFPYILIYYYHFCKITIYLKTH